MVSSYVPPALEMLFYTVSVRRAQGKIEAFGIKEVQIWGVSIGTEHCKVGA